MIRAAWVAPLNEPDGGKSMGLVSVGSGQKSRGCVRSEAILPRLRATLPETGEG